MTKTTRKIPNGWREVRLCDKPEGEPLVELITGHSYKSSELVQSSGKALITLKNFGIDGSFQYRGLKPFNGLPKLSQEVKCGDLVVAHTDLTQNASVLGNPVLIPNIKSFERLYITMDLVKVVPNQLKIDKLFLYYTMRTRQFKGHCVGRANGTTVLHLPKKTILDFKFFLPPLPEQKAIAEVLSSLDDKIDLLHRQSQTLESLAQALFRKWFIDNPEREKWEKVKLGDFFSVKTGKKDANYATDDGQYPFFTCAQNILRAPGYSFEGKAILLAGNGDFNVKRYEGKFEAYQRTYVLIPYKEKYFGFLYTLIKFYLPNITGGSRGSVIRFITKGMIENFSFNFSHTNIDTKLKQLNEIYSKVDVNQSQIRTLENLRDTLLPKLMSGEVRVKF